MQNKKNTYTIDAPDIPDKLENYEYRSNSISDEFSLFMKSISNCTIENQIAERGTIKQLVCNNVTFKNVSFKYLDIINARFINCDFSNIDLSGSIIHRIELIKCKHIGTNLTDCTLRNVIFENCNGNYSCFRFSNLGQVSFNNCILENGDFEVSVLSKVFFDNCNLQQAQFSKTKLKDIDLSTDNIDGIGVRIEDLNGAIVSPLQAVSLARKMGLIIKE